MKPEIILITVLLALVLFLPPGVNAGRLDKIEKAVKESKPPSGYHPVYPPCDPYWYDYYWPPYSTFNLQIGYGAYPYRLEEVPPETSPENRYFSLTVGFDYFYDVKGDLEGFGGRAKFRTPFGTIEGDFTRFREEVEESHDYLNLYYCDYLLSFLSPQIIFSLGAGYSGLSGEKHYNGCNLAFSIEVFPASPFLLDLGLKYSMIHDNAVGDYRVGFGLAYEFAELRAGYRYLTFENAPSIHGPEIGLNLWF